MEENILIVDDDIDIINLVKDILEDEGYKVDYALNGKDGENKILSKSYDLVLLDVMLPDMNGQQIMKNVRDEVNIPIIFLTAKSKKIDKILGFEVGADDYITKPFDDMDLLIRVKAHLRREKRNSINIDKFKIGYNGISIDKNSYEVFVDGENIDLSTMEFNILTYLMENPNIVLSREKIYEGVWGYNDFGDVNTVTVHIKKLREKIDKEGKYIKTVWGAGYKFLK